jgi:hypothetical protein
MQLYVGVGRRKYMYEDKLLLINIIQARRVVLSLIYSYNARIYHIRNDVINIKYCCYPYDIIVRVQY